MERFFVKVEHSILLRQMYVSWDDCEFGAPAIDCKRPYGNSDAIADILHHLKLEETEENISDANKLHKEMRTVLQILVCNCGVGIRPGWYESPKYTNEWKPLRD